MLNFTILLLRSISYYEQQDSRIEWNDKHDKQINKNTKIQNYIGTGHKGLETNLSNAILNSNNNYDNDINNNTSHSNNNSNNN